jgi:hypothetical protein
MFQSGLLRDTKEVRTMSLRSAIAASSLLACLAAAGGCSETNEVASLSVSTPDSTMPAVGQTVRLVVRAIYDDGSSADVTDAAACALVGATPPGTLEDKLFTAAKPGAADVRCSYAEVSGGLSIVVQGDVLVTARQIQTGEIAVGTRVTVETIVTALDPESGTSGTYTNFYGQDAGGGAHSGLYFRDVRDANAPAVAEGDKVRVTGEVLERLGRTVLEFDTVESAGTGALTVDELTIDQLDPAMWDGCLVRVKTVEVTADTVDTYYWQVAAQGALDGPNLLVDTLLYDPKPAVGDKFGSITGTLYVFEATASGATSALEPRRAEDVVK